MRSHFLLNVLPRKQVDINSLTQHILNINTTLRILMISSPTNVIIKFLLKDRIKGISHRIWIVEKDTGFSWNFHSDFSHFPVKQKTATNFEDFHSRPNQTIVN